MAKLDLNDENEKKLVDGIFWNAMDSLSDDDKKLPQVCVLLGLSSISCSDQRPEFNLVLDMATSFCCLE